MPDKVEIAFFKGELSPREHARVSEGFEQDAVRLGAPQYDKERVKWLATDHRDEALAALTADILWDWIYVDELWVAEELRGRGLGSDLMRRAEDYGRSRNLMGIWLWTQSWQAEGFYRRLGYSEFTRFEDFPKSHSRIGFRKLLAGS